MATLDISQNGRRKTMLIYRQETGLALRQADSKGNQSREIPLTVDDLETLASRWPEFRMQLWNAGVEIAKPATPYPNGSKASPEPGS